MIVYKLVWLSINLLFAVNFTGAQEKINLRVSSESFGVKGSGSSTKVGGGFSRFRDNIKNVQQKQQQQPEVFVSSQLKESIPAQSLVQTSEPVIVQEKTARKELVEEQQSTSSLEGSADSEPAVYGSVSGAPGVDFPNYTTIPNTKFSCDGLPYQPGMYADESTNCQVYHLCYAGRKESFLCGVGTVFNQAIMNCDFWSSVECSKSSKYYQMNAEFGKSSSEPGGGVGIQQRRVSVSEEQKLVEVPAGRRAQPAIKSSFVKQERVVAVMSRPTVSSLERRVESSSLISGGAVKGASKTTTGKMSARRQSSSGFSSASSQGLISPSRRVQLMSSLSQENSQDSSETQFASGSSNRFKMADSPGGMGMELAMSVEGEGKTLPAARGYRKLAGGSSSSANEVNKAPPLKRLDGNSDWRPYFKSNSSTSTTARPSTETRRPLLTADQKPSFSAEKPAEEPAESERESGAERKPARSSAPPTASSEADLSPALATTSPAPSAAATEQLPETSSTSASAAREQDASSTEAPAESSTMAASEADASSPADSRQRESESSVEYAVEGAPKPEAAAQSPSDGGAARSALDPNEEGGGAQAGSVRKTASGNAKSKARRRKRRRENETV